MTRYNGDMVDDVIDPDVDDDGELNVERFTPPDDSEIRDPYMRRVMARVRRAFPGGTFDEMRGQVPDGTHDAT